MTMITAPASSPTKVRDAYCCNDCKGETSRIRLDFEDPNWGGVTQCRSCNGGSTYILATGLVYVEPEHHEPAPRFARGGIVAPAAPLEHTLPRGTYDELFK